MPVPGEDCLAFYVKKNFLLLVDINDADCSTRNNLSARASPVRLLPILRWKS